MFCLKCGKEIDNNATSCPYCNSATENAMETTTTIDKSVSQPAPSVLGTLAVVFGAIGIVLGVLVALLGYVFGGVGLGFAIAERKRVGFSKRVATGLVLSIVALIVALGNSILGIILYGGL